MGDEQDNHSGSDPLVRRFAPKLITHQQKKQNGHQEINRQFYSCFRFHSSTALLMQVIALRLRG